MTKVASFQQELCASKTEKIIDPPRIRLCKFYFPLPPPPFISSEVAYNYLQQHLYTLLVTTDPLPFPPRFTIYTLYVFRNSVKALLKSTCPNADVPYNFLNQEIQKEEIVKNDIFFSNGLTNNFTQICLMGKIFLTSGVLGQI